MKMRKFVTAVTGALTDNATSGDKVLPERNNEFVTVVTVVTAKKEEIYKEELKKIDSSRDTVLFYFDSAQVLSSMQNSGDNGDNGDNSFFSGVQRDFISFRSGDNAGDNTGDSGDNTEVSADEWQALMVRYGRIKPVDTRPALPVELWQAGLSFSESEKLFDELAKTYKVAMGVDSIGYYVEAQGKRVPL